MKIKTIQVGSFGVNCSILYDAEVALVVDPGAEGDSIRKELEALSLKPTAILLTHAHFDHIGAVAYLQQRFAGLPVMMREPDLKVFTHPMNQYPPDYPEVPPPTNVQFLKDGNTLNEIQLIPTPGHTPGGVCYYLPEMQLLLAGDTLFYGSFGRTDLPGGDYAALVESLQTLAKLPPETKVIPGHGMATTIGRELPMINSLGM